MKNILTKLLLFVAAALLVGLIVYRINTNKENDAPRERAGKSALTVGAKVIQPQQFSEELSLSGSLEANEQITIQPEISGLVVSINFQEGAMVAKGQVLLTLNDAELQAQLNQVKTQNNLALENNRRAKLLLEKEAISREEYESANATYRSSLAQIQLIQAQLSKTVIRAPFSGIVGLRNISKGGYITPATVVAQLVNVDQLKVTFSIPEKYASKVQKGQNIQFNVDGSRDRHTAKIYAIEPTIQTDSRTLQVKALAPNTAKKLMPGQFATVNFPLEATDNSLLIPSEALIPIQNGKKVFLYKNGKAKEVLVQIGSRTKDDVVIVSGMQAGDTLLTTGVMTLKDGAEVTVKFR